MLGLARVSCRSRHRRSGCLLGLHSLLVAGIRFVHYRHDPRDQAAVCLEAARNALDDLIEPQVTERSCCRVLALRQGRRDRQEVAHECRQQLRGDGEVALEAAQRSLFVSCCRARSSLG